MTKIMIVSGARPNFVKIAPIIKELKRRGGFNTILIHTGQHYDFAMSQQFFEDLGLPEPDVFLGAGSGSHAEQTARIMTGFEKAAMESKPDVTVVVGDVNSTMACAITAAKLHIPVAHVEAGLRSFDRMMPEEINRIVTDSISDLLFVSEPSGKRNLLSEGTPGNKIYFVGNVMIDTLIENMEKINSGAVAHPLGEKHPEYAVVTLHRPSNVDNPETLSSIAGALGEIAREIAVIFPAHPRTAGRIEQFGLKDKFSRIEDGPVKKGRITLTPPMGYLQFQALTGGAKLVLTDSGGIQEETTYLGIPCITIRENTERPVTTKIGTNTLTGANSAKILSAARKALSGKSRKGRIPKFWDGKTASRIVTVLEKTF